MEEVIAKYNNKPLKYGELDCHLLVLDFLKYDTTKILGTYTDYKSGAKIVPKLTGYKSLRHFLESNNYQEVSNRLISDGCIVLDGISCSIYWGGCLFGIYDDVFRLRKVSITRLNNVRVYKWLD